jgi:transposase-like protein
MNRPETTMTDARMALLELIEKDADADLVRELLAFAAERMMAMEVDALTRAPAGARSAERVNHRNGYRERGWGEEDQKALRWTVSPTNPVGRIELAIPKLRPRRSTDRRCFAIGSSVFLTDHGKRCRRPMTASA